MKKVIVILLVSMIFSCRAYQSPTRGDFCMKLLEQRSSAWFNDEKDQVRQIDSLILKCKCDSLK